MNKLYEMFSKNDKAAVAIMSVLLIVSFSAIYVNLLGISGLVLGIAIGASLSMSLSNGITTVNKKANKNKTE